jgi:23S rRNA (pseudouridine1915-N3)-methyltransferase
MKIKVIALHKTEKENYEAPIKLYSKRLSAFCDFELIEIQGLKNATSFSAEEMKKKEGAFFLQKIKSNESVYLLDEKGKGYTSEQFADFISKSGLYGENAITFLIGGAFGFSDEIYALAKGKITLSLFTMPHQLARLVFLEQLYRCMTIIKGHPYHHR